MGLTRGRDEGEEASEVRWCSRNENRQSVPPVALSLSLACFCVQSMPTLPTTASPSSSPPPPAGKEGGGGCRGGGLEASFPCVRTYSVVAAPLAYYTKLYTGLETVSLRGGGKTGGGKKVRSTFSLLFLLFFFFPPRLRCHR